MLALSAIARLAAPETIGDALNAESCFAKFDERYRVELAFIIARDCQRLFIICIAQGISLSFFAKTTARVGRHDSLTTFVDNDLPLTNSYDMDPKFYASFINKFYSYQYKLLTPHFEAGVFDMPLSHKTAVPVKQGKWLSEGAEGEIYDVRVHRELCPLPIRTKRSAWSLKYALKVMKDGATEIAFLRELQAINFNHPHLLMPHFGFSYSGKNFLVSDKAVGDLDYLFETSEPADIGATSSWLWAQMRGLADALASVHDLEPGVSTGYLHDIKPQNILVFLVEGEHPVLKFTDWGFAKITPNAGRGSHKTFGGGDIAYAPPERSAGMEISRPYDIWSLGCMFMEMLVWFTEGRKGYLDFTAARIQEFDRDVQFHLHGKMSKTVSEKLDDLYAGDWRVAIKVIDAMLRIRPEKRITAAEVVDDLEDNRRDD